MASWRRRGMIPRVPPPPTDRPTRPPPWLLALGLLLLTAAAWHGVLAADFVWDDDDYVTQNPLLRDAAGLWSIWFAPTELPQYYPVVHTTFWLEFQLWGLHPAGYHVVNVLLHAANALLLQRVLARLGLPGAWLAALVFALHPVHVESVAWITERKNVLSGLFYLLAARAFLRWQERGSAPGTAAVPWPAFAWFALALLAKTTACSLPAALLLLAWWRDGAIARRLWLACLPFLGLGFALAMVTAALERGHVRAEGTEFAFTFAERLLIAGRAPWHYLATLVWPVDLCFNYERWQLDARSPAQWAFPAATLATLALLFAARRRLGRGPLAAMLFFGGTLVPALGFFNVYPMRYSFVADHFQYLASLGPITLAAAAAAGFVARQGGAAARRIAVVATAALAVLLGVATAAQVRCYTNRETLWQDTLRKNPRSWLAMTNLAGLHIERGELDAAVAELERSLAVHDAAETRFALGTALHRLGRLDRARSELERGVALAPERNDVRAGLGAVLLARGETQAALETLQKSLAVREDYDRARAWLGATLVALGRHRDALPHLQRAIALNPMAVDAFVSLARAHAALGEGPHTVLYAANALLRDPNDAATRAACTDALAAALPRMAAADVTKAADELLQKVPAAGALLPELATRLAPTAPATAAALRDALEPRAR
jgi:tetratricopeptide (TPR) repeat protein